MVKQVKLFTLINGYNPPENYLTIQSSSDIDKLEISGYYTKWEDCKHTIERNMGTVIVKSNPTFYVYDSINQTDVQYNISTVKASTIVWVMDTDSVNGDGESYFGVINSIREISSNLVEIDYTIDWYTSQVIMNINNTGTFSLPNGEHILYKRKADGEFNYLAEGMTAKSVTNSTITLKYEYNNVDHNFFDADCRVYYMVYRAQSSDTMHKIICVLDSDYDDSVNIYYRINPLNLWTYYQNSNDVATAWGVAGYEHYDEFDPNSVIFFGYIPLDTDLVKIGLTATPDYYQGLYKWHCYMLTDVDKREVAGNPGVYVWREDSSVDINYIVSNILFKTLAHTLCTEYKKYRIVCGNGTAVYDIPYGRDLQVTNMETTMVIGGPDNAPYITFIINTDAYKVDGQLSFSIPFNQTTYYSDSYEIYLAEERKYQVDMRNLNSINQLAEGIVGGINQGAMISAFSRDQTGKWASGWGYQPPLHVSKGLIGGTAYAGAAMANYAYQRLYANKEAQRIEDNHSRNKPDTMVFATSYPKYLDRLAGLQCISYDSDTITAITNYQSRFGYQTNAIGSNVALNSFTGYVQAEVILAPGLRTEIESYIMDMFRNGVRFNAI